MSPPSSVIPFGNRRRPGAVHTPEVTPACPSEDCLELSPSVQIGHILPASMPGLRTLRHLEVRCLGLLQFPLEIAGALWRLTKLDLASNRLRRIPPAITKITALHTLDLSLNRPLQLVPTDVDTLASMPGLSCLGVYKQERNDEEDAGFSQTRLKVLLALHARLPQLQLPGLEL